ncbi:MAG: tRNA modification GTPase [Planctomycetales bacterium]
MPSLPHPDDTIAALASPPGGGARGIVRVSGPRASQLWEGWFQPIPPQTGESPFDAPSGAARRARCISGTVSLPGLRRPLPIDLYWWPTGRSYTGQPLAEAHTVGVPPLLEALLAELYVRGARPAQPGEFTLRAFLAGRLDLLQAEAVLGVIDACQASELERALRQLGGGLSSQVVQLRGDLLDLLADLEAGLDFAEEDIEFISHPATVGRLGLAAETVAGLLDRAQGRWRSVTRPRVTLAGFPNAGKSTLFNALVGSPAALVSPQAGTTRDYLVAETQIGGVPVLLVDTAGGDDAGAPVVQASMRLRTEQLEQADLILWCTPVDAPSPPSGLPEGHAPLVVWTKSDLQPAAPTRPHAEPRRARREDTKVDLQFTPPTPSPAADCGFSPLQVSARTREGLARLARTVAQRLNVSQGDSQAFLGTTAARCRDSLLEAQAALGRGLAVARTRADAELLAIELRDALDALGRIVGAVYTDDLLDRIFSKFCIGK